MRIALKGLYRRLARDSAHRTAVVACAAVTATAAAAAATTGVCVARAAIACRMRNGVVECYQESRHWPEAFCDGGGKAASIAVLCFSLALGAALAALAYRTQTRSANIALVADTAVLLLLLAFLAAPWLMIGFGAACIGGAGFCGVGGEAGGIWAIALGSAVVCALQAATGWTLLSATPAPGTVLRASRISGPARPDSTLSNASFSDSIANPLLDDDAGSDDDESAPRLCRVQISGLHLTYRGAKRKALDGVDLELFDGQVVTLLGHNGAGKTSLMGVMSGMLPPSSYDTARIHGLDLKRKMHVIRRSLGWCPQHDILIDTLTVHETLVYYSSIKGLSYTKSVAEADSLLLDLRLQAKVRRRCAELSGGQRRRVSACAAFCGSPRLVILDEPSSGLDPLSRRALWRLIRARSRGRAILISTQHMDEASIGDSIVIMSGGKIRAHDSKENLIRQFGTGLTFTLELIPTLVDQRAQELRLDCLVEGAFGGHAKLIDSKQRERMYEVPTSLDATGLAQGSRALDRLIGKSGDETELRVVGYNVAMASLEDVFMRVTTGQAARAITAESITAESNGGAPVGSLLAANEQPSTLRTALAIASARLSVETRLYGKLFGLYVAAPLLLLLLLPLLLTDSLRLSGTCRRACQPSSRS